MQIFLSAVGLLLVAYFAVVGLMTVVQALMQAVMQS